MGAGGDGAARGKEEVFNVLTDRQIEKMSFDLWLEKTGSGNRSDVDRLKSALPIAFKECCTEKQAIYITRFFLDGMKMKEISALYGVNKSVVSRTINRGLENLYDYLRFCSPDLVACARKRWYLTQNRIKGRGSRQ